MIIRPIDQDDLREHVRQARPFPHCCIDDFLDEESAEQVARSFPTFEEAAKIGRGFSAVNEKGKIQVTDSSKFAGPIAELNRALAAPDFLNLLSHIFAIPDLLADPELVGGGIHQTGARGHLDVHVDFNYIEDRQLHRRLNILVYFNKGWKPEWGGNIELWDKDVKVCHHSFSPVFNRCVVFETSEISYHGVTAVQCPEAQVRKSFAAYYYTKEAPQHWNGEVHSTNFKARPDEIIKGNLLMPLEKAGRRLQSAVTELKRKIKR
jgi:Rps23 Pro-64 3,4-dihydroxylase Tpa1-like proline 4-hydroxylase